MALAVLAYWSSGFVTDKLLSGDLSLRHSQVYRLSIVIFSLGAVLILLRKNAIQNHNNEIITDYLGEEAKKLGEAQANLIKISTALDNVHQAVVISGVDDMIEYTNGSFYRIFGFSPEESLGKKISDLIAGPETDMSVVKEIDKHVFKQHIPFDGEILHYRKDGTTLWAKIYITPILNEQKELERYISFSEDITDFVQTRKQLDKKNAEIIDSIQYAKTIQKSTLPTRQEIGELFSNFLLIYKPKDIVSGDFYNMSVIRTNDGNELTSFIIADCTGHGVPGAMLAINCSNIIRSTFVNPHVNSPSEALEFTRSELIKLFSKSEKVVRDGMDVGFGVWDKSNKKLYYSGGNMNCYIKSGDETITIKGDRTHVGYSEHVVPFSTKSVELKTGDQVFLTTDGYLDQFADKTGKKFGRKRFLEAINQNTGNLHEFQNTLLQAHEQWKGDEPQLDDICVFGFEVS